VLDEGEGTVDVTVVEGMGMGVVVGSGG